MTSAKKQTEIIIVGGGLIGTSIALALSQHFSVRILEKNLPTVFTDQKNVSHPISLSYGSMLTLKKLGVWSALQNVACPILSVHVSEQNRFGMTKFTAQECKTPALGYVIPFTQLQTTLYQHAAAAHHVMITSIKDIQAIQCDEKSASIHTTDDILHTQLLIAADGTHSTCRDLLNIPTIEKNTGDTAHIYQLTLADDHNHTAYERFTKSGVLAILPQANPKQVQLVWTMTQRVAATFSEKNILPSVQNIFDGRLSIIAAKKITQFPIQTIIAEKQIAPSAVLMGNAAHTIYPVAAQGFNLGLYDVATLSEIFIHTKKNHSAFSVNKALQQYEQAVLPHQHAIYQLTRHWIGAFDWPLIGCARGLGLCATDIFPSIKNKFAKRAMGMS